MSEPTTHLTHANRNLPDLETLINEAASEYAAYRVEIEKPTDRLYRALELAYRIQVIGEDNIEKFHSYAATKLGKLTKATLKSPFMIALRLVFGSDNGMSPERSRYSKALSVLRDRLGDKGIEDGSVVTAIKNQDGKIDGLVKAAQAAKETKGDDETDFSHFEQCKPLAVIDSLNVASLTSPILILGLPRTDGNIDIFPYYTEKGAYAVVQRAIASAKSDQAYRVQAKALIRFLNFKDRLWSSGFKPIVAIFQDKKTKIAYANWLFCLNPGEPLNCVCTSKIPYIDLFPANELVVISPSEADMLRDKLKNQGVITFARRPSNSTIKEGQIALSLIGQDLKEGVVKNGLSFHDGTLLSTARTFAKGELRGFSKSDYVWIEVGENFICRTEKDEFVATATPGDFIGTVKVDGEFFNKAIKIFGGKGRGVAVYVFKGAVYFVSEGEGTTVILPTIDEGGEKSRDGWTIDTWADWAAAFGVILPKSL